MSMNEMITTTGQDIQPMDLMERAIATGADPVVLEKLMMLHERWEASRAHKAYAAAIADAKAEFKKITKSRSVDFSTTRGRTNYRFEDMNDIAGAIDEPLSKHGLSYRWRTVSDMQKSIHTVTCIISHRDGYSEENSLTAVSDNTGNKNNIQAVGSTVTYLQRYTLKSALGLTVSDDDDARGAGDPISSGTKAIKEALATRAPIVVPAEVPYEEPYQMEPPDAGADSTQAWHEWCRKFMGLVRTSPDIATHLKWIDLNIDTLELLKEQEPTMRANLGNSLNKNHEALRGQKDAPQ
jgi:hypothetical protein